MAERYRWERFYPPSMTLQMEKDRPPAKECGPPLKARRDAETDSSLAPPEETWPSQHFDFSPVRSTSYLGPAKFCVILVYCFKPLSLL